MDLTIRAVDVILPDYGRMDAFLSGSECVAGTTGLEPAASAVTRADRHSWRSKESRGNCYYTPIAPRFLTNPICKLSYEFAVLAYAEEIIRQT